MTKLERIQLKWNRQIDSWQEEVAKQRPIPEEHQSLAGKRDCWRGFVRPLMNVALETSGTDFRIPDRLNGSRKVQGVSGIELFGDMSSLVRRAEMRPGDVVIFILKRETHIALVIDKRFMAHATDFGVHRLRYNPKARNPLKVLRYNGPGSDVFG